MKRELNCGQAVPCISQCTLVLLLHQVVKISEQRWSVLSEYGFSASGLPKGDFNSDATPVLLHAHMHYLKVCSPIINSFGSPVISCKPSSTYLTEGPFPMELVAEPAFYRWLC